MSIIDVTKVKALKHACVRMQTSNPARVIYVDPCKLTDAPHDADVIFITHPHGDHFSTQDIANVAKPNTVLVSVEDCRELARAQGYEGEQFVCVAPGQKLTVCNIFVQTIPAYNVGKAFHTPSKGWVGYKIDVDGMSVYVMGDTDANEEVCKVRSDVLCVPIGGIYTMNMEEAAHYINEVKPTLVIPVHYGAFADMRASAEGLRELVDVDINVRIDI